MSRPAMLLALLLCISPAAAEVSSSVANPIRKVVTMLQSMQEKVEAEGKKEKKLYDAFMCYCKTGAGDLEKSIEEAGDKAPALGSDIKASEEQLVQTKEELAQAQKDRSAAKAAVASATASRGKEATAYAAEKAEYDATISAITKAVAALEKGMAGAFLQTQAAKVLQQVVNSKVDMIESDRQDLMSFLSGAQGSGYVPSSGEVTGILKDMGSTMSKALAEATSTETGAIGTFNELVAAKTKEIEALTSAIETKMVRVGDLGVSIVQMKNDLTETEAQLLEDKKFLAELGTTCKTKEAEWAEAVQTRAEESAALAETIKVLNDDDALEIFKKTLPGSSASSFVQVHGGASAAARRQALAVLAQAKTANAPDRARIDLIAVALRGKTKDFSKVIALIDDMVTLLKQEQLDDDHKKEYCHAQLDLADDKKKSLEAAIATAETAMQNAEEGIATVTDEIATLEKGIKALDKAVVQATEQRKEEHEDYTELMASDSTAKELLLFAKNRLNKFYQPKLYKPPPARELSAEDTIATNFGATLAPTAPPGGIAGTGITLLAEVAAHRQLHTAALPEAPAAPSAYKAKTEESTGVIAMMDLLVKDLDKQMTEAETAEKEAQADYEELMKDSAQKRALDSSSLTSKTSTKASLEGDLQAQTGAKQSATKELMATLEYTASLHGECDWLLQYFDVRKAARAGEIEALGRAKDVLSGADYSL